MNALKSKRCSTLDGSKPEEDPSATAGAALLAMGDMVTEGGLVVSSAGEWRESYGDCGDGEAGRQVDCDGGSWESRGVSVSGEPGDSCGCSSCCCSLSSGSGHDEKLRGDC